MASLAFKLKSALVASAAVSVFAITQNVGANENSSIQTDLTTATLQASRQASSYCGIPVNMTFLKSSWAPLQTAFDIDQSVRFVLFASNTQKKYWADNMKVVDKSNDLFLMSLLSNKIVLNKLLIYSNQSSFEILIIALHIAQRDPKTAHILAQALFHASKFHKNYSSMASMLIARSSAPLKRLDLHNPKTRLELSDHLPVKAGIDCSGPAFAFYRDNNLINNAAFLTNLKKKLAAIEQFAKPPHAAGVEVK